MDAFASAEAEARSLHHPSIASQHLVLGLFLLGSGLHFSILRKLGCTADSLRQGVTALGPTMGPTQTIGEFAFAASAGQVLERAAREAAAMSHIYIGTEHLLLALLAEESGGAASLFTMHRADVARARRTILDAYSQP